MKKPIMAIQLYTLRDYIQTAADFDSTLARLAAMGVKDVQISGIGDIPAETQKEILEKHGMRVCVTHKSFEWMKTSRNLAWEKLRVGGHVCATGGLGLRSSNSKGQRRRETVITVTKRIRAHPLEILSTSCVVSPSEPRS